MNCYCDQLEIRSELIHSMKPLLRALQLHVRNHHPPCRRSNPSAAAANTLLRYRKQDLDNLQLATRLLIAGCSFGDRFYVHHSDHGHDSYRTLFLSFMLACKHFWPSQPESSKQSKKITSIATSRVEWRCLSHPITFPSTSSNKAAQNCVNLHHHVFVLPASSSCFENKIIIKKNL